MTIEKAIERLTELAEISLLRFDNDDKKAVQLGIEALKLAQSNRRSPYIEYIGLLPGETKED